MEDNYKELKERFESKPQVQKLLEHKRKAIITRNFALAMEIETKLDSIFKQYLEEQGKESSSAIKEIINMGGEDAERNLVNFYTMLIMINIMDFMLADINESLGKHGNRKRFVFFNKLMKMGKELSEQVKYMLKGADEDFCGWFADESDAIQEVLMEIVRKEVIPVVRKSFSVKAEEEKQCTN